jgi:hypothetical protein
MSGMTGRDMRTTAAVTIDVHESDQPDDVLFAAEHLAAHGIRATFFVPATLFQSPIYVQALRGLPRLRHEVGSHGLLHDWPEVDALIRGTSRSQLAFLEQARTIFEDFYGSAPKVFRAPVWCWLNERAVEELVRLGYRTDSSATPQRLNVLGSLPFDRGWLWSHRSPYYLGPDLVEVPNSTILLPAASPTFRFLRRRLSSVFLRLLFLEARLWRGRVVVLQFDSRDLNPSAMRHEDRPIQRSDFLLQRAGGLRFKRHVQEFDPPAIAATADMLLSYLSSARTMTLSEVREEWLRGR